MILKPVPHVVSRGIPNHSVAFPFPAKEDLIRERLTGTPAPKPLMPADAPASGH